MKKDLSRSLENDTGAEYNSYMSKDTLSKEIIEHIVKLAKLNPSATQIEKFQPQLASVFGYISKIQTLKTNGVMETSQVTGLENVMRDDMVDEKRMLSQDEALRNAKRTHNGFFVVDAVLKEF